MTDQPTRVMDQYQECLATGNTAECDVLGVMRTLFPNVDYTIDLGYSSKLNLASKEK